MKLQKKNQKQSSLNNWIAISLPVLLVIPLFMGRKKLKFDQAFYTRLEAFITQLEGVRTEMYLDSKGIPTIGIGHVILPTEREMLTGSISRQKVSELFQKDIKTALSALDSVNVPLKENQAIALTSLAFNIGKHAFKSSTLVDKINKGIYNASDHFLDWIKETKNGIKVVNQGLVNRRKIEKNYFEI